MSGSGEDEWKRSLLYYNLTIGRQLRATRPREGSQPTTPRHTFVLSLSFPLSLSLVWSVGGRFPNNICFFFFFVNLGAVFRGGGLLEIDNWTSRSSIKIFRYQHISPSLCALIQFTSIHNACFHDDEVSKRRACPCIIVIVLAGNCAGR